MSEPKFTASKENSAAYFNALNEYMENNVLRPDKRFICKYGGKCKESCRADDRKFYPGQLSHVGPLYDLARDGKPFRVIISGAEYGYPEEPHSLEARRAPLRHLRSDLSGGCEGGGGQRTRHVGNPDSGVPLSISGG